MIANMLQFVREILLGTDGPAQQTADQWIKLNGSPRQNGYL